MALLEKGRLAAIFSARRSGAAANRVPMYLSTLDITQLIAAYHCAILACLLLSRPRLRGLTLLCATFSVHMAFNLGVGLGVIGPAFDITSAFGLVYGPAFYLFVRGVAAEAFRWQPVTALHALPALVIAIWQPEPPIPYLFGLPSLVIYIGLALQQLYRHGRQRAEWRSDDLAISLDWVHAALVAFIALALMDIGREVIGFTSQAIPDDLALAVIIVAVVSLLTLMTRAARSHDDKRGALPDIALTAPRPPADEDETRYAEAFARIGQLIEREAAWQEPRLSLTDLATRLRLSPRDVSRAINLHGRASFARFINGYRVRAIDALMADPDNAGRTIMELAYEAGFNSKSTFNRIYREVTGKTPTEAFELARVERSGNNEKEPRSN